MQLFYKFVLASVIFAFSVVAKLAINADGHPGANCANPGPLTEDFGDCHVNATEGMMSTADCTEVDGAYYYCVIEDDGYCLPSNISPERVTGGECFSS